MLTRGSLVECIRDAILKKQQQERLENAIAMGKWPFIVRHGVLAWGLSTAVLYVSIAFLFQGNIAPITAIAAFVSFPLLGIAWGGIMWRVYNRRWTQHIRNLVKKHRLQK